MANFEHLSKLDISEDVTVDYPLNNLKGTPTLKLAPATADNKPFFNEVLRLSRVNKTPKAKSVSYDLVQSGRDRDRELFAKHVIKGWAGVIDSDGKEVPFSLSNVQSFLTALPDWIFDEIRDFSGVPENFIEDSPEEDNIKN